MTGPTVEFTQDKSGQYRWKLVDEDGLAVAMSPDGYDTRADAETGYRDVTRVVNAGVLFTYPNDEDREDVLHEPERPRPSS